MENLWPDIINIDQRAPVIILREQAALLGERTANVVIAKVTEEFEIPLDSGIRYFAYNFYIVAPALADYRYKLFQIYYSIDFYPLFFLLEESIARQLPYQILELQEKKLRNDEYRLKIDTEEKFLEVLKAIFNTEKTKKVIAAILAQIS